jgi:hypothetical protein
MFHRRRARSPSNDLALKEDPELEHPMLATQRRRVQAFRWVELRCQVEKRYRVRAVGYVVVSLSMTRGTYKHIRSRMMYSSSGLTVLSSVNHAKGIDNVGRLVFLS